MSQSEKPVGVIIVTQESITVRCEVGNGTAQSVYAESTIENLQDAARVLAAWMELRFENVGAECQRVHRRDQFNAFVRETVEALKRS